MVKLKDVVWGEVDFEEINTDNAPAEENGLGGGTTVVMCCGGGASPVIWFWCYHPGD